MQLSPRGHGAAGVWTVMEAAEGARALPQRLQDVAWRTLRNANGGDSGTHSVRTAGGGEETVNIRSGNN